MAFVLDGVLAHSQGVPQLDGLVAGSRHDLPVVGREGNGEHILGVADKTSGGLTTARGQVSHKEEFDFTD